MYFTNCLFFKWKYFAFSPLSQRPHSPSSGSVFFCSHHSARKNPFTIDTLVSYSSLFREPSTILFVWYAIQHCASQEKIFMEIWEQISKRNFVTGDVILGLKGTFTYCSGSHTKILSLRNSIIYRTKLRDSRKSITWRRAKFSLKLFIILQGIQRNNDISEMSRRMKLLWQTFGSFLHWYLGLINISSVLVLVLTCSSDWFHNSGHYLHYFKNSVLD